MATLRGIIRRTRKLWEAAPMREFTDYDDYWRQRGEIRLIFHRWSMTAERLPNTGSLLDVGCGTGEFLTYLHELKPELTLAGADGSVKSVQMTRELGFEAVEIDLLRNDLPKGHDFITCFEVLEHIADAEIALRNLRDACGKRLFVSVPNVGYIGCRVRLAIFGRFPTTTCVMHIKEHVRFWTVRDFKEWVTANDLRVVSAKGTRGLGPLYRLSASLFASTILYEMEPIHINQDRSY